MPYPPLVFQCRVGGHFITEEVRIANRYSKFGVAESQIHSIVQSGIAHGFTRERALIGARLALSLNYGVHECFTPEETASAIGGSISDVMAAVDAGNIDHVTIRPRTILTQF